MAEKKDQALDKGCIVAILLGAIFFLSPIIAWWWPVAVKLTDLVKRWIGVE